MKYMVIYAKANGELIYRYRKTHPNYSIGDNTSMGWKVIDIKRFKEGQIVNEYDYSIPSKISRIGQCIVRTANSIDYKFVLVLLFFKLFV